MSLGEAGASSQEDVQEEAAAQLQLLAAVGQAVVAAGLFRTQAEVDLEVAAAPHQQQAGGHAASAVYLVGAGQQESEA